MSGVILAVPDRPEVALRVLAAAARLAELTGSDRINVIAVRTPPLSTIVPSEEVLTRQRELRIRNEESQRADTLKQIFDGWSLSARASNVVAEWTDIEGLADRLVEEWGSARTSSC